MAPHSDAGSLMGSLGIPLPSAVVVPDDAFTPSRVRREKALAAIRGEAHATDKSQLRKHAYVSGEMCEDEDDEDASDMFNSDASDMFNSSVVGTYSCHGMEPGESGSHAKINQDCACVSHPVARQPGTAIFCVFDGHGRCGDAVSQEIMHSCAATVKP